MAFFKKSAGFRHSNSQRVDHVQQGVQCAVVWKKILLILWNCTMLHPSILGFSPVFLEIKFMMLAWSICNVYTEEKINRAHIHCIYDEIILLVRVESLELLAGHTLFNINFENVRGPVWMFVPLSVMYLPIRRPALVSPRETAAPSRSRILTRHTQSRTTAPCRSSSRDTAAGSGEARPATSHRQPDNTEGDY